MQCQLRSRLLGGLTAVGLLGPALAADRPNIVFILADDLGYADVGFQGCRDIPTPNIDSLAASGVRFTSGYAAHPFCSPMRASFMTGRYQHRFGYENNIAFDPHNNRMGLPLTEKTIPERLKAAGYSTGMVGKWHLGAAHQYHPNRRGFDFFHGFLGGGHDYFQVSLHRPMGEGYQVPIDHNGKPRDLEGYLTEDLTRAAVDFIRSRDGKPFFLYAAYNAPHTPMQAPEERLKRFAGIENTKRRAYAAMVSILDDGVGEILAALDSEGVRDDTFVCFLSDNGGPTNANASNNRPLRGDKGSVFEGGIRVPFVVSWPAQLPRGQVFSHPVISHDLSVTALALAGISESETRNLDGVNLIPHLLNRSLRPPHAALFWRMNGGTAWAARSGEWKLLQSGANATPELYNLADDISEEHDLMVQSGDEPDHAARVRSLFDQWNQGNKPPFFPGFREYHQAKDRFYRELVSGRE